MAAVTPGFIVAACAIGGLAACLSGCLGARDRSVALSDPEPAPSIAKAPRTDVKTVRPSSRLRPDAGQSEPGDPARIADAMPSPSQIFDFHPPGSKPDSWRQPFIIDYSDGPLNNYRTVTAAELKQLKDGGEKSAAVERAGAKSPQ